MTPMKMLVRGSALAPYPVAETEATKPVAGKEGGKRCDAMWSMLMGVGNGDMHRATVGDARWDGGERQEHPHY